MNYNEFIQDIIQTRGRHGCGDKYYEQHHIVPKCLGGTDDEQNLIDLYATEHYIAHKMLSLEHSEEEKLVYAWWLMSNVTNKYEERYELTPEEYELVRMNYSNMLKAKCGEKHHNFGKHLSDECKKKISEKHKGKQISDETRLKMSESHKGQGLGSNNSMARKILCEGQIFGSIVDCAKFYNIPVGRMKAWLIGANKMPLEFIEKNLQYYGESRQYQPQVGNCSGKTHPQSKRVICDNVIYDCMADCARFYGETSSNMSLWLLGRKEMPEKYRKMGLGYIKMEVRENE